MKSSDFLYSLSGFLKQGYVMQAAIGFALLQHKKELKPGTLKILNTENQIAALKYEGFDPTLISAIEVISQVDTKLQSQKVEQLHSASMMYENAQARLRLSALRDIRRMKLVAWMGIFSLVFTFMISQKLEIAYQVNTVSYELLIIIIAYMLVISLFLVERLILDIPHVNRYWIKGAVAVLLVGAAVIRYL